MEREAVAEILGVSVHTLKKYIDGTRRPKWETVEKMKPVTGKSFEWWRRATIEQIRELIEHIGRKKNGQRA